MNVFVLKFDHKHGTDIAVHSSKDGAFASAILYMRSAAAEWGEEVEHLSDDELWRLWAELSGETEFFSIDEYEVFE